MLDSKYFKVEGQNFSWKGRKTSKKNRSNLGLIDHRVKLKKLENIFFRKHFKLENFLEKLENISNTTIWSWLKDMLD